MPEPEPQVDWYRVPQLPGVMRLLARHFSSDLSFFHESVNLLCLDAVRGDRGPVNHHRRLSHVGRPGDALVFAPGYAHRAEGGQSADFRVLLVPAPLLRRAACELTGCDRDVEPTSFVASDLYGPLQNLHGLLSDSNAPVGAVCCAFQALLEQLLKQGSPPRSHEAVDDGKVRRAREYIDDFLRSAPQRDLDIGVVAEQSGYPSIFGLCRDFKQLSSVSPYQYFKLRKLEMARRLLAERKRRSVLKIALDLGYTPQAFARSFKQVFQVSAREYRGALSRCAPQ